MGKKQKMSDHYIRLGMSLEMKEAIEKWRSDQFAKSGSVPSFSEACRQLINEGLVAPKGD